jgi:hypothetical protein
MTTGMKWRMTADQGQSSLIKVNQTNEFGLSWGRGFNRFGLNEAAGGHIVFALFENFLPHCKPSNKHK